MDSTHLSLLERFKNEVGIKFQLFNSLFTSLPFHRIEKTGILLSMLLNICEEEYARGKSPVEIINQFFGMHTHYQTEEEKLDLLFRFIQYAERQVVLFDALEDAAYTKLHDMTGPGTMKSLQADVEEHKSQDALKAVLRQFGIRLVLTAHPTQFYPGEVLGIITDLSRAIETNNNAMVNLYLQQLGKTPFLKKNKPTPYDEAMNLLWFLENVFYQAAGRILFFLKRNLHYTVDQKNPLIRLGFWPGGDRDGNPNVNAETTLKVAAELRGSILKCYYGEVRRLKRRLTFKGIDQKLVKLEKDIYRSLFLQENCITQVNQILEPLREIRQGLKTGHAGLFIHLVENLINRVEAFGLYFASLDIRQDSSAHAPVIDLLMQQGLLPDNYASLEDSGKINALAKINATAEIHKWKNERDRDVILSMQAMKTIQQQNGEAGCHRYVISHSETALQIMEVYGLLRASGWNADKVPVDIVPLFETVEDLHNAASVMQQLYQDEAYKKHLENRNMQQTIMLGFSDGTKDGGYLMANYSIYKAKEELTHISRQHGVDILFFDGRGGPPSRGGGKTSKFYASMGQNIAGREIQLTIQGQTVSSNFGTVASAQFNMEQLLHAGISNQLQRSDHITLEPEEDKLLGELSELSFKSYRALRDHPNFLDYLSSASPLKFYADTNISSRPAKRGGSKKMTLSDLRAIPFVGSWSQIKQTITGFYGLGTALKAIEAQGKWQAVKDLYENSLFFKTLIDNCEMTMKKCYFPLTAYLGHHAVYGKVWHAIHDEYQLTRKMVLKLNEHEDLMDDYPVDRLSIEMRERIVLPLTTIQQYGLAALRKMDEQVMDSPLREKYGNLVMRCSFGIINAGRNSA